jgi:hypothetical protein
MMAGILGVFDTAEGEIKAERVARAALQRAHEGQAGRRGRLRPVAPAEPMPTLAEFRAGVELCLRIDIPRRQPRERAWRELCSRVRAVSNRD